MVDRTLVHFATTTSGTRRLRLFSYPNKLTLLPLGRCRLDNTKLMALDLTRPRVWVTPSVEAIRKFPPLSYAPSTTLQATLLLITNTDATVPVPHSPHAGKGKRPRSTPAHP